MNRFISKMCKTLGIADTTKLNCCRTQGTIIDDSKEGFCLTLPDGTRVEVYTPFTDSLPSEQGFAYIPDYDQESPDMCAEDLGVWVDDCLDCSRRIDAYYDSIKGRVVDLDSAKSVYASQDAMSPEENLRAKDVFRAACSAVDLPPGFRYQDFRTSKNGEYVLRTLQVRSEKLQASIWVCKSALQMTQTDENIDDWGFIPNYNPESEGHLIYHREGRFVEVDQGLYQNTVEGDTPEKRDKKAAYWLAGLLSDMAESIMRNPPARCYEFFLSAGLSDFSKTSVLSMQKAGVLRLVSKGFLEPETVLKARPELAKDLVEKKLIVPEIVARRAPDRILWLVQKGYISPDYAIKVDPTIKDKLIKKGLYSVTDDVPDDPTAILEGVKSGTIKPIDAYRKNPKLLQPMVEQGLITPQEAYKLDASIVTWLLLNKYIGRAEAMRVKPDIQKYVARRYKDVNWDDLDASADSGILSRRAKPAGLNSSLSFNSKAAIGTEGNPNAEYGDGYEQLSTTTAEGPGFVAEVMLPEDDFDGIVVPGETEDEAKETLTQMLLANDGTFIDWKSIPCIQTFKSENADKNFLVLN